MALRALLLGVLGEQLCLENGGYGFIANTHVEGICQEDGLGEGSCVWRATTLRQQVCAWRVAACLESDQWMCLVNDGMTEKQLVPLERLVVVGVTSCGWRATSCGWRVTSWSSNATSCWRTTSCVTSRGRATSCVWRAIRHN